jgi:hypothetical protein
MKTKKPDHQETVSLETQLGILRQIIICPFPFVCLIFQFSFPEETERATGTPLNRPFGASKTFIAAIIPNEGWTGT